MACIGGRATSLRAATPGAFRFKVLAGRRLRHLALRGVTERAPGTRREIAWCILDKPDLFSLGAESK